MTIDWLESQRRVLEENRKILQEKIEAAERDLYSSSSEDELTLRSQREAYSQVQKTQIEIGQAKQERDALLLSISDSASFIANLERKLNSLNDSSAVAEHVGVIHYHSCPSCLALLEELNGVDNKFCHLCKTPFNYEDIRSRLAAMINDTAIQLKQSRMLQVGRRQRLEVAEARVKHLDAEWLSLSRKLASLQRLPSTELRQTLRNLHTESGYLKRQLEDLNERERLVSLVQQLSNKKDGLNQNITKLRSENELLRASQQERLAQAYTAISDEVRILLHNDLRREQAFEDARSIEFTFSDNKVSVDGQSYFSASSRVILKSSFFLGFLAAATKKAYFRHPRFVMIDTIEDKGMEPQRSHNFQMQIARVSSESKVEHQIIFATAMISPDLDDEAYTIGTFSTRDDYTIAVQV